MRRTLHVAVLAKELEARFPLSEPSALAGFVAAILEGKIEQVVERCYPLVPVQIGWHPVGSYLKENSEARP
jgi:hypothetical protein